MTNLNLLFHKIYYNEIGNDIFENAVEACNAKLFDAEFIHQRDFQKCEIEDAVRFRMKTQYPGLLIGIGYPHGSGRADDDIKCGFSFDYVSGQPYISGSSVKGVLRSHFETHPDAVAALANIPQAEVKNLESNIFENSDIFLDAVLYDGDQGNHILGADYITPHSAPTKNPIPIHIMKVLPGVRFEFRFITADYRTDSFVFKKEQKTELFKTLLAFFGIGAKTNIGYGILKPDDSLPVSRPTSVRHRVQNQNTGTPQNVGSANRIGHPASCAPSSEKVRCPKCGYNNFKFNLSGRKNQYCRNCNQSLP